MVLGRDAWLSVWAKSVRDEHGVCTEWLPLQQHLDDTMAVAGRLVEDWVSPQVVRRLNRDIPGGVSTLARWLAGVHDVGKASPAFVVQVQKLADHMRGFGLDANPRIEHDPRRREVSHAIVGHLAVRDWLCEELGFAARGVAGQLGSIVGSHHGVPPESSQLAFALDRADLVGAGGWDTVRRFFLQRATERVGGVDMFGQYRDARLSLPSQALLTAIVIVADWIASNDELFPLHPISSLTDTPHASDRLTAQRLETAWARLDFPQRWAAPLPQQTGDRLFQHRFGRPAMRPVQRTALDAATTQTQPGMIVVEAPMGEGKTEAALLAAEVLAHRSGADGLFVALPTQATTDAMFSRVRAWLERLPSNSRVSVRLAHGKAHLNDEFGGLVRRGRYVQVGDDNSDKVVVHQWFAGRKRAGLASFVVGTIDQVLFAGLKSRHVMLRHLALAGKVVVIDEVHAYDVYMSQYLHRVLRWLGAYGVPVVLLSATLPPARRAELLHAYDNAAPVTGTGYPLVSGTGGLPPVTLPLPADRTTVRMDKLDDSLETLTDYLHRHLAAGGCAVVVRNTVTRVQETAAHLAAVFGQDAVSINHSRFLGCDRARNDRDLIRRFGPPTGERERPWRHIVVASQVVEQSLDLDFDLLVTDLAPIDLLLQRLGRVHRHDRDRPVPLRQARCVVVGVEGWDSVPVTAVRGSRRVYGDHVLLRAAAILCDRDEIALPHDIAPLVQLAYDSTAVGPVSWQPFLAKAEQVALASARSRRDAATAFLLGEPHSTGTLVGWLRAGVGDTNEDHPRGIAQVRDGAENLEVLIVQHDADGGLLLPDWIDGGGTQIPLDDEVPYPLARIIATCTLRLPLALSHEGVIDAVITELERNRFTSFDNSPLLAGHLILVLDHNRHAELHGFHLTYDPRRGLIHRQSR